MEPALSRVCSSSIGDYHGCVPHIQMHAFGNGFADNAGPLKLQGYSGHIEFHLVPQPAISVAAFEENFVALDGENNVSSTPVMGRTSAAYDVFFDHK